MLAVNVLLTLACSVGAIAGVTIIPGGTPKPYKGTATAATSLTQFFRGSAQNEFIGNSAQVLFSSLDNQKWNKASGIQPSGDSFVRGAIQAWGEHLHLEIRPEEVWFTILVQMNFYMNAHAEDLRSLFVNFTGQQTIYVEDDDWYKVLRRFDTEIQARVKTPWLLDWMQPNFTTTTEADRLTSTILMMGLTKAYFRFEGGITCGLPSVTLLGTQADWKALLTKLDRLPDFGADPSAYKARLRPILSRFVTSFKEPDSKATHDFWNQIVSARASHVCGGPPYYISGWITGFYFWDTQGKPWARGQGGVELDGVKYASIDLTQNIPVGYARAPFTMRDFNNTEKYEAYVAAGTMGKKITQGAPAGFLEAQKRSNQSAAYNSSAHATLRPLSSWMLYGPVQHNATEKSWVSEDEPYSLLTSIRSNFNEAQCAAGVGLST